MTIDELRASLEASTPPASVRGALLALWHDAKGDWDAAHRTAQDIDSAEGRAHILRRRPLDPGKLQALAVIERNARAQTRLIEDMLDVSRIAAGKVVLDLEPTSMVAVVQTALDAVRPRAEAKGIRLLPVPGMKMANALSSPS